MNNKQIRFEIFINKWIDEEEISKISRRKEKTRALCINTGTMSLPRVGNVPIVTTNFCKHNTIHIQMYNYKNHFKTNTCFDEREQKTLERKLWFCFVRIYQIYRPSNDRKQITIQQKDKEKRKKSRCIFAPNPKAKIMCELCVEFRSVCSLLPPATKKNKKQTQL